MELAAEEAQKNESKTKLHQAETQLDGYRTSLETAKQELADSKKYSELLRGQIVELQKKEVAKLEDSSLKTFENDPLK